MIDFIIGITGLSGAAFTIAVIARRMHRKWHGAALWLLALGMGVNSLAMLFVAAGTPEDVFLTNTGDALLAVGFWAIIVTRRFDEGGTEDATNQ